MPVEQCTLMLAYDGFKFFVVEEWATSAASTASLGPLQRLLLGHFSAFRAFAQALFVVAIFSAKSSSKAFAICSGGPDSMMLRSGKPWLKSWSKLLGRDRLT